MAIDLEKWKAAAKIIAETTVIDSDNADAYLYAGMLAKRTWPEAVAEIERLQADLVDLGTRSVVACRDRDKEIERLREDLARAYKTMNELKQSGPRYYEATSVPGEHA